MLINVKEATKTCRFLQFLKQIIRDKKIILKSKSYVWEPILNKSKFGCTLLHDPYEHEVGLYMLS